MRILVLSADRRAQDGLRMRLDTEHDLHVVGPAGNHPDLVLLDVPNGDADRAVRQVVQDLPGIPLVVLTLSDDSAVRQAVLQAGAAACVSKHDGDRQLLEALRNAALQ